MGPTRKRVNAMSLPRAGRSILAGVCVATLLASGAAAETPIQFSLDFGFQGPSAPFLLALDKGYYRAEGLNITFQPASGSLEPISRVASGDAEMGFGDIDLLIKLRDTNPNMPVKAVFMVHDRPPFAVVGRKSRGINLPKDLEGKKLGAPDADSAYAQWPIFVKANAIDASKVAVENISSPVREPMLAAGQVDAITGFSFSLFINLKEKGIPVNDISVLLMADYGLTLYGDAIIVNTKFAAEHPEEVKGFLRAFVKGLKETMKSPSHAIESVLKRNDQSKKEIELERLNMALHENILTPEVRANGFGGVDGARFTAAVDQIAIAYKFKGEKPKLEDIFDASFLPAAAERKAN